LRMTASGFRSLLVFASLTLIDPDIGRVRALLRDTGPV
jgi:hypothetical protein